MQDKTLAEKMLEVADRDKLPEDHILRVKAEAFAEALEHIDTIPVNKFVGRWAAARRAYCDYTGEPLI